MIPKCKGVDDQQELIIHLSEDVSVEHIFADNQEDFSANLKLIEFEGSSEYPPQNNKWKKIGSIAPAYKNGMDFYLATLEPSYL